MTAPYTLAFALRPADSILDVLKPYCIRVEIAGSIRRRFPVVNDIDFVIETERQAEVLERIKSRCRIKVGDSPTAKNTIAELQGGRYDGMQLDFFFARPATQDLIAPIPSTFGTLFLCRTGPKLHNIQFAEHCLRQGLSWDPYKGVKDGKGAVIACETEEACYAAAGLKYLHPVGERENPRFHVMRDAWPI